MALPPPPPLQLLPVPLPPYLLPYLPRLFPPLHLLTKTRRRVVAEIRAACRGFPLPKTHVRALRIWAPTEQIRTRRRPWIRLASRSCGTWHSSLPHPSTQLRRTAPALAARPFVPLPQRCDAGGRTERTAVAVRRPSLFLRAVRCLITEEVLIAFASISCNQLQPAISVSSSTVDRHLTFNCCKHFVFLETSRVQTIYVLPSFMNLL